MKAAVRGLAGVFIYVALISDSQLLRNFSLPAWNCALVGKISLLANKGKRAQSLGI
jgi:hypothetical protein